MNFPAFNAAEEMLKRLGYEVSNPASHGTGEGSWADYMRRDITDMLVCDGIALLPNWGDSKGARLEIFIATELEIPYKPITEWVNRAPWTSLGS